MHVANHAMPDLSQDAQFSGATRFGDLHALKFPNQIISSRADSLCEFVQCPGSGPTVGSELLRKRQDVSGGDRAKRRGVADRKAQAAGGPARVAFRSCTVAFGRYQIVEGGKLDALRTDTKRSRRFTS